MELFYTTPKNLESSRTEVTLEGDEFHHLVRVVRKKPGDEVLLTDGNGSRLHVRIREIAKHRLTADILTFLTHSPPRTAVTVAMSLLKAPHRFDLFLEKATELGVTAIIPMITARTIAQLPRERVQGKLDRWQGIVLSASRQSKRLFLPRIHEPQSFRNVLDRDGYRVSFAGENIRIDFIPVEG
ncbi:MAG: 16S rRNA (uracil(1498)-N(3))-methyltransferase, partial [Chlorobiaceae bacterium]|nr:16S rRNA (uracil(1498)-N(3))-methyltransferase [Chlorobiaceae bacterium]